MEAKVEAKVIQNFLYFDQKPTKSNQYSRSTLKLFYAKVDFKKIKIGKNCHFAKAIQESKMATLIHSAGKRKQDLSQAGY